MQANQICGLFKFYRQETRLDQLIAGTIHANTAEFYRTHKAPGVRDPYESVSWAYREEAGDPPPRMWVNDRELTGLTRLTVRGTGMKDRWLHCWTILRFPESPAALDQLVADLQRMREEFGTHYGFIFPQDTNALLGRIQKCTKHEVNCAEVSYTNDMRNQSPVCKAEEYRYQREWRILIGEPPEHSTEPLRIDVSGGLSAHIHKDPPLRLFDERRNIDWLTMDGDGGFTYTRPQER